MGRHRAPSKPLPLLALGLGAVLGAAMLERPVALAQTQSIVTVAVLGQPKAVPDKKRNVIRAAISKIGRPYVWGAKGVNDTYDCSGLTEYAWKQEGVEIGPSTFDQIKVGIRVDGPPQPGDLIFSNWGSRGPNHVALAVSDKEIVEAPGRGMVVRKTSMPKSYVVRRVNP